MPKFGPRYKVPFRRKREGKTDYRKRLKLLKSGKPRLVARVSANRVQAMISKASSIGDYTLVHVTSEHLKRYGWKGGTKNTPAAYLVGYLCGKQALQRGITEAVLDIGRHAARKGARVFAVLKGALDAGLQIPHEDSVLPGEDRIAGRHIVEYAKKLKQKSEEYQKRFSQYLSRGLPPEELEVHFMTVKDQIMRGGSQDETSG